MTATANLKEELEDIKITVENRLRIYKNIPKAV